MAIINIHVDEAGQSGIFPRIIRIETDDTIETIVTPGYLNNIASSGVTLTTEDMVLIAGAGNTVSWLKVEEDGSGNTSLVPDNSPASADLPTTINRIAHFSDTVGTLSGDDANVFNLGAITISGDFIANSPTTNMGELSLAPADNAGDFRIKIRNASHGQATSHFIPDPGQATANFLIDQGPNNIRGKSQFISLTNVLAFTSVDSPTWTLTRQTGGDYRYVKAPADDTTIIGIDITPSIRTISNKGFRLNSINFMYNIATAALDSHTVTLDRIEYANNSAVSVNSIAISGSLATATQGNPYLSTITVDSPAFDNAANSKYVVELVVNAAATTDYDLLGLMINYDETIG